MHLYTGAFVFYIVSAPLSHQEIDVNSRVEVDYDHEVETDYDHEYDFTRVNSYAWSTEQQPASNLANHIRIVKAVSESLDTLGLTPDTKKPDVRILYRLETEETKIHVDSRQHQSPWDPTDLETTVALGGHEEAYVTIEMYESATGRRIWRAKCSHPQPTPDKVERSLYETVEHLFAAYPSKEKKQK